MGLSQVYGILWSILGRASHFWHFLSDRAEKSKEVKKFQDTMYTLNAFFVIGWPCINISHSWFTMAVSCMIWDNPNMSTVKQEIICPQDISDFAKLTFFLPLPNTGFIDLG